MKKILLAIISVLILLFSSFLIYHILSKDSAEIDQSYETEDTTVNVMNEIDVSLLNEDYEVEIGEII